MVIFLLQTVAASISPTRAQNYVKTHKKLDETNPNDVVREQYLCYSPNSLVLINYL